MSLTNTNRCIFVLALIGAGLSAYLTASAIDPSLLVCSQVTGCHEVEAHSTAHGFGIPWLSGIPTAAFGLVMFAVVVSLAFVRTASGRPRMCAYAARCQWIILLSALCVSIWLTCLEAFVIHAWCQWCVLTAITVVLLFITSSAEGLLLKAWRTRSSE